MNLKVFVVKEGRYLEPSSGEDFYTTRSEGKSFWVDIMQPNRAALEGFLSPLHLHPLIIETALDTSAGSRIAPYEGALFIKFPTQLGWDKIDQFFLTFICLHDAIITVHNATIPALEGIAKEFSSVVRFNALTTSAILYQILDRVVQEDMAFALEARRKIDLFEESTEEDSARIDQIMTVKRRVTRLSITFEDQHHCIATLRTIVSEVFNVSDFREYFHDTLADLEYAIRFVGRQEAYLSELRQHHLLNLQDRTNKRLRLLTIISAVFMPLSLIAGIYGMNFLYMPELKWHCGYPFVLIVMLFIASVLLWLFYRRGWFR